MFHFNRFGGVHLLLLSALATVGSGSVRSDQEAPSITWSHDDVIAGYDLKVNVSAATCFPITVTLILDGAEYEIREINAAPTSLSFPIPRSAAGKSYKIVVACANEADSDGGLVL